MTAWRLSRILLAPKLAGGVLRWIHNPGRGSVELRNELLDRVRGALPEDVSFEPARNGSWISYQAPRGGGVANPLLPLRLPLPAGVRLRLAVEEFLKLCQMRIRMMAVEDWPARDDRPYVHVSDTEIRLWYGASDDEGAATLRFDPIPRSRLGV